MSRTETSESRKLLSFPTASSYMGFLLTCHEEPAFSRGSVIYEERLNKIYVKKQPQSLHIAAFGDPKLITTLEHMAVANGGTSSSYVALQKNQFHSKPLSVEALLRSVRLHPIPMDSVRPNHLLLAIHDADASQLGEFMKRIWDLGAHGVELAFVKGNHKGDRPSHFIRLYGVRHADAFHAWCRSDQNTIEVFAPLRTDRRESRFYVAWGYRYPIADMDQLIALDRELVLLRPKSAEKSSSTEWITFSKGTVNFFRKAYEFTDLQIDLDETPLIELEEDAEEYSVPLELALVHKPKKGPNRIWQLDQQIDRHRRELRDLEMTRSRMAAGEQEEVYFAYRFEQPKQNRLNARLVRLLQQRIGTLSHYDYAYCKPRRGNPFHLVISNHTQRQMGFSLQPADRVYYQPSQWRQWGVNLYVPLNTELAPRIDVNDALPILQKFLEAAQSIDSESDSQLVESTAVIWEPGRDERIDETRVEQAAPLLSQFRLLNSFQRETAGHVHQGTQKELLDGFRSARESCDQDLDEITRKLLQHIGQRTEKLQSCFAELSKSVRAAEVLLEKIEPQVMKVRDVILDLPDQWIQFVNGVIELHRSVVDPEIAAAVEFKEQLNVGRDNLRALAVRNRDLSESVIKRRDSLSEDLAECEKANQEGRTSKQQIDQLLVRATAVFQEISKMHSQISKKIERVNQIEVKAQQMQEEIDQIDEREADVTRRIEKLEPLHDAYQEKAAEVEIRQNELEVNEQALSRKSTALAQRRASINSRLMQLASQMERIDSHLRSYATSAEQMDQSTVLLDEQLALVDAHSDALQIWNDQEENWRHYMDLQHNRADDQIQQLHKSIGQLEDQDSDSEKIRELLNSAKEHLAEAETVIQKSKR